MEPENPAIDGKYAAKQWLLGCAGVAALVGNRAYFSLPQQTTPAYPAIEVARVGGGPDGQGRDYVELGLTTYATTEHEAGAVALEICRYLNAEEYYPTSVSGGYRVEGGRARVVTQIAGLGDIRRYSVTGWLLVRKET